MAQPRKPRLQKGPVNKPKRGRPKKANTAELSPSIEPNAVLYATSEANTGPKGRKQAKNQPKIKGKVVEPSKNKGRKQAKKDPKRGSATAELSQNAYYREKVMPEIAKLAPPVGTTEKPPALEWDLSDIAKAIDNEGKKRTIRELYEEATEQVRALGVLPERTCATCKHWYNRQAELAYDEYHGYCLNPKILSYYNSEVGMQVMVRDLQTPHHTHHNRAQAFEYLSSYSNPETSRYKLVTADTFGCNHWGKIEEPKNEDDDPEEE